MAEGILRRLFKQNLFMQISSAGTHAIDGNPAAEFAVIASLENGIDISGHMARLLDEKIIEDSDIILCMEPAHIQRVISLNHATHGKVFNLADFSDAKEAIKEITDPYGSSLHEYRKCFKTINICMNNFIDSKKQLFFCAE
jgi:protein-tyrosine-phosphatase